MHATTSPKFVDQQQTFLVALAAILFAVGIALGSAMDLDLKIAPAAATVSAPDNSYDAVEKTRAQFGIAPDNSYNQVESLRAQSGVTVATEYDVLHAARAKAAALRAKSGVTEDTTLIGRSGFPSSRAIDRQVISAHDMDRGAAGWWASAPSSTLAGTPVSQADPNDRVSGGVR
jgi:hypothetical protein